MIVESKTHNKFLMRSTTAEKVVAEAQRFPYLRSMPFFMPDYDVFKATNKLAPIMRGCYQFFGCCFVLARADARKHQLQLSIILFRRRVLLGAYVFPTARTVAYLQWLVDDGRETA